MNVSTCSVGGQHNDGLAQQAIIQSTYTMWQHLQQQHCKKYPCHNSFSKTFSTWHTFVKQAPKTIYMWSKQTKNITTNLTWAPPQVEATPLIWIGQSWWHRSWFRAAQIDIRFWQFRAPKGKGKRSGKTVILLAGATAMMLHRLAQYSFKEGWFILVSFAASSGSLPLVVWLFFQNAYPYLLGLGSAQTWPFGIVILPVRLAISSSVRNGWPGWARVQRRPNFERIRMFGWGAFDKWLWSPWFMSKLVF